jgi:hypothetical protein
MGQFVENLERDVLATAGGGDTSHAGGPYEQALDAVVAGPRAPAATGSRAPAGARRIEAPEPEPVDLLQVAGASVGRRLLPVGLAVLVLIVAWRILRGGRRTS